MQELQQRLAVAEQQAAEAQQRWQEVCVPGLCPRCPSPIILCLPLTA